MDLFSTDVLTAVVQDLKRPPSFLLDNFFPAVQNESSEEIHFDVDNSKRRMAPFVSPLVEGKIVAGRGFTTNTFRPAYVKDKRVWDGSRALKRMMGERIGGSLTPEARMQAILALELEDQIRMLNRRFEWMAANALYSGSVTVSGEKYPSVVVDFGRDGALTVTLSGGNRWDQSGVNPLDNLQTWANLILQKTGVRPTKVVMTLDAWAAFRNNTFVKERISTQRRLGEMPTLSQGTLEDEGGTWMGQIDGFDIYAYSAWYVDDNGVEQPILPAATVLMVGPLNGVRAFGAIKDETAGYQPLEYFPKSWVENDPPLRFLMMQSAPLMVPYRVNASLRATVL